MNNQEDIEASERNWKKRTLADNLIRYCGDLIELVEEDNEDVVSHGYDTIKKIEEYLFFKTFLEDANT
jgi:hypothetical protein